MRVLQVMAAKGNGGAELYSTDLMLSLHQAGLDQCVVMRGAAPRAAELAAAGLRMAPDILAPGVKPWQRLRLRQLIAREKPDIIHCWMRRAASLVPPPPEGGPAVIGWFGDYEEIRYFSHCSHFVGVTQDLVAHMGRHGVKPEICTYLPTFSSVLEDAPLDRASLGVPPNAKMLLTLSRLHQTKGLDTLIRALPSLPDCVLCLAGEGPEREALAALAARIGVAARVKFLGWRTDRGALLRAADICVLPSRYEPFGTVILDAWSAQTPLVACASAGPAATVTDRVTGLLAPVNDAAALAAAIQAVNADTTLRERLVAQGLASYHARFSQRAVTDAWMAYYRSLAG
jgi:glycosyltransferase involved in cell wall biosynthesis